ncbi:MAG: CoA pyrophosphatase [Actinomycetes bacterium]
MDPVGTLARLRPFLIDPAAAVELEPPGSTESAVLVPFTVVDGRLCLVLTRRRDDLRRHAGEFSFPGGRRDPGEKDLLATALRETHEEIGIEPTDVEIIGALQPTSTIATGFSLHPFVGLVPAGAARIAEPAEVAEITVLDVAQLMSSADRALLSRRDVAFRTAVYPLGDKFIWGATARILADLFDRIEHSAADPNREKFAQG